MEDLAEQLRLVRKIRKLSLQSAASQAGISATYLQKLERGEVKEPSPRVLQGLSRSLDVPYKELLGLAGYLEPDDTCEPADIALLEFALSSEPLTDDETKALAEYLAWYRYEHQRHEG